MWHTHVHHNAVLIGIIFYKGTKSMIDPVDDEYEYVIYVLRGFDTDSGYYRGQTPDWKLYATETGFTSAYAATYYAFQRYYAEEEQIKNLTYEPSHK